MRQTSWYRRRYVHYHFGLVLGTDISLGLSVHMSQVHKENLTAVDNALPNRAGLDIEIFGMEGIPEEIVIQHNQRVLTQFHQAEAERRANSGNAASGGANGGATKKPKTEEISDIKKRLAEHKAAKLAAERNGGGSSGSATPVGAGQAPPAPTQQSTYQAASSGFQQYQQPYAPPPSTTSYGQPAVFTGAPIQTNFPPPGYGQAGSPVYGQPPIPQPYQPSPYGQPPQPNFQQQSPFTPQSAFSPPPFTTQGSISGQPFQPIPPNGLGSYPGQPIGMPRPFVGSPVPTHQHQQRTHSPAHNGLPQRTGSGSLPAAPGLPQRPAVGAPPVNAFQFQQMHQGQIPPPQNHVSQPLYSGPPGVQSVSAVVSSPESRQEIPNAASIDDLISSASKQADANATTTVESKTIPQPPAAATVPSPSASQDPTKKAVAEEKAAKKDKDKEKEKEKPKQTRLVYSDNDISPEEKMALLPKYAFTPQQAVV